MGHATRVIPIIRHLLEHHNTCVIGITPSLRNLIAAEFPDLEYIEVPSYNIRYSSARPVWSQLIPRAVDFFRVIKQEHQWLKHWVKANKPDLIISDNRYGIYMPGITSWIICHQMQLKTPVLKGFINRIHRKLLKPFDLILVPDFKDIKKRLAGDLSFNRYGYKCIYIEPLSRLRKIDSAQKYDFLFLLSGAEPSQGEWLSGIIEQLNQKTHMRFAVCSTSDYKGWLAAHVDLVFSPTSLLLSEYIAASKTIVLRSGYSSLMDMHFTGKNDLILVPSKGQTEQKYLADYWQKSFGARVRTEQELLSKIG